MRIPPSFYYTMGRFLLFIAIEAACIVMAANNGVVQQYKIVGKLRNIQAAFWNTGSNIKAYSRLKSTNAELALQNKSLMEENMKLRQQIFGMRGDSLASSLISKGVLANTSFSYDWAKVIKNSINTTHNYLIINKGSNHGITEDMGVVTPYGVVGIVRAVSENHSYILSFLNQKQQISAKVGDNVTFGPLSWDGKNLNYATLNEIPQHVTVTPGDTLFTSGYSSFFPPDIPVGIAESSKIVNGMHRSVKVRLLQDFRMLDYVIVVKNNHFNEIGTLSEKGNNKIADE